MLTTDAAAAAAAVLRSVNVHSSHRRLQGVNVGDKEEALIFGHCAVVQPR